ncbi:MAG: hypothetical protein AABX48_03730 [Nanoarchaeota archaeon]
MNKKAKFNYQKKGAMEMSVGTIVTIVLLVSVLVLGLILIKNIFSSATGAVKLTDAQLTNQINQLFSVDQKLVIAPSTATIKMRRGDIYPIKIGIKNRLQGNVGQNPKFDYKVYVDDPDVRNNCGIDSNTVQSWIQGGDGKNIPMPSGEDIHMEPIGFNIPSTAPLCSVKIRVEVLVDNANYASSAFFMQTV